MDVNPILIEVFKNRFASICEEMGMTLMRTGFSPNIKERRDFSCALFDAQGEMIAQAAHIPVHLGSMPLSVQAAIAAQPMERGDMVILNDPFKGGTHLPDITLVAPVFADDEATEPSFYVANRAHHADVGGISAGSMPLSTSIFQEGIIIPPLTFVKGGEIVQPLLTFFLNNLRTPQEREGDFAAQVMANVTGVKRAQELIAKYGLDVVQQYADVLLDYAETVTRAAVSRIPDGEYEFEDFMDSDGITDELVPIRCLLSVQGDTATLDFSASGPQVQGSVNAVRAITLSAVLYVFRALITENISTNAGCLRPLTVVTQPGTIVDARFPAAVAGGNVETSQRIVDVILGALAQALPQAMPAASQGTMNNITIGGYDPHKDRPFAYYETLGGGMGATRHADGESAVHSHMTNTLNTPVEAMEYAYPFLVREYGIRRGSGGAGAHTGGNGMVREIELTADAEATVLSERRRIGPYGLQGGEAGGKGRNVIIRRQDGTEVLDEQPGKFNARLHAGDRIRMETPGGGGWGEK
ncbi:hydantoinase B/oxoprolinase family protein [Oceanidesulfovibrio marinus]|uniref:Hydantoinase B/oxoprolinase family protein n=1 Tax=Oceanidesulfovibrio marinus TaxID=370038 RepID=A0A6P1ZN91_9BACT|nr:hydantoinase B/oxoprolinase family protein [Oceanidesulfovibrio marinus]TVM35807.1 hydantoinase B/oxoprolinase family protein [Oceanidesulfovibrio marinus]